MRPTIRRMLPTRFDIKPTPWNYMPVGHRAMPWLAPLCLWGAAAGTFVTLLMSPVPLFQKDVLLKIPGIKDFFEDTTPISDKPF